MGDLAGNTPTHRWADVQRLGLVHGVTSIAEYERLITIGSLVADEYLRQFRPEIVATQTAQIVHRLMFEKAHPWAGNFRTAGESVIVGGYPGADPWRIRRELGLIETQLNILSTELATRGLLIEQNEALLCAFHHIRFERIHPFRDGNGRVGRLLLAAEARERIDHSITFDWKQLKSHYFDALSSANRGDLAPFANTLLLRHAGVPMLSEYKSPFRIGARMFDEMVETSLDDDLNWSKVRTK